MSWIEEIYVYPVKFHLVRFCLLVQIVVILFCDLFTTFFVVHLPLLLFPIFKAVRKFDH